MKICCLFNKEGKFISFTDQLMLPNEKLKLKIIDLTELGIEDNIFNVARFRWEGDYDNGKLIDLFAEKKVVVLERDIDAKYYGLFYRKYTLDAVIEEILLQMSKLGVKSDIVDFFSKLIEKREKEKEFFRNSEHHIFESDEDINKRTRLIFENERQR